MEASSRAKFSSLQQNCVHESKSSIYKDTSINFLPIFWLILRLHFDSSEPLLNGSPSLEPELQKYLKQNNNPQQFILMPYS